MKIKGSKLGTIVASTGVVIFTLAAAFSGSMAWFSTNRTVSSTGATVKVHNGSKCTSAISFYPYVDTNGGNYRFSTTATASITNINNNSSEYSLPENQTITMGKYSEEIKHQPVLIILTLNDTGSATIRARRSGVYSYDYMATQPYESIMNSDQTTTHPLSSAIEFFSFTYDNNGVPTDNASHYTIPTSNFTRKLAKLMLSQISVTMVNTQVPTLKLKFLMVLSQTKST